VCRDARRLVLNDATVWQVILADDGDQRRQSVQTDDRNDGSAQMADEIKPHLRPAGDHCWPSSTT